MCVYLFGSVNEKLHFFFFRKDYTNTTKKILEFKEGFFIHILFWIIYIIKFPLHYFMQDCIKHNEKLSHHIEYVKDILLIPKKIKLNICIVFNIFIALFSRKLEN